MSAVRSFPFASLDALSRAEVDAAARLRRASAEHLRVDALVRALEEMTGSRVEVLVRRYRRAVAAKSSFDAVGIVLEVSGEEARGGVALLELDGTLATTLASRALQRPPPRVVDSGKPAPPALSGATAALILACARRAHQGAAFRVLAAGPAASLARDFASRHPESTTAWLAIVVGADAYDARVTVPDDIVLETAPRRHARRAFDAHALRSLGDVPLALPIVAATCLALRSEIASLAVGDAFVVPSAHLQSDGAQLTGSVILSAPRGERALAANLAENGRLVVRERLEAHPWDAPASGVVEGEMSGDGNLNTTAEVLEDAPVVVRVELGTVEMTAREWASLAPGDVISLGRKVGDPALLRIGGVEVAHGELVQIDGDYGVRILGRPRA